jgi:hypothetical protein
MFLTGMIGELRNTLLITASLGLCGCLAYEVETTLRPDGSGLRQIQIEAMSADDLDDYHLSDQEFRSLLFLSEDLGWSHETEVDGADTIHIFRREERVDELDAWQQLNDDIRIAGALPSRSGSMVGYVALGDVQFHNRVLVETSRKSDGTTSFRYVETFLWEKAPEAILEIVLGEFGKALDRSYPDLPDQARGEVLGFARASLWRAVEEGVFDSSGDEEDLLWQQAVERTADQALNVVRNWYPHAEGQNLREELDVFSGAKEERLLESLMETLPGLNLAINSEISFRLTLPGRVSNSNAHGQDGHTLVWEFAPTDALTAPIVILAESEIRG